MSTITTDALRTINLPGGWRIVKRSNTGLRERGDGISAVAWYVYRFGSDCACEITNTLWEAKKYCADNTAANVAEMAGALTGGDDL